MRPAVQIDQRAAVQLGLRLAAFVMAWWGTAILANTPHRTEETALVAGLPFLIGGVLLWLGSELYIDWPKLRQRKPDETEEAPVVEAAEAEVAEPQERSVSQQRVVTTWLALGLLLCVTAWYFTTNNKFTLIGFLAWALSIGLWTWMLSPVDHGPRVWLRELVSSLRGIRWRSAPTIALLAVLLLGAAFRFSNLEFVPPEMTSDHVELILDSFGVQNGRYNVFFANNGGRESLQMYTMALFSELPGLGMNYYTLKLLTVIEGMIAIVLMYWMGRELIGSDNRRLGTWVGLCLAALVAASYWHTVLSRLGLRIVLTTIIVPLLLVFLARAMRFNRREDYHQGRAGVGLRPVHLSGGADAAGGDYDRRGNRAAVQGPHGAGTRALCAQLSGAGADRGRRLCTDAGLFDSIPGGFLAADLRALVGR